MGQPAHLADKNLLTAQLTLVRLGGMKVIGLTGGISSGKSTVARFLKEMGAVAINTDKVGHEALKPDTGIWREVVVAFGREIIKPNGEIDRKKLGEIVFKSPEALLRLNKIVHPYIYNKVKAQLERCRRQGIKVVVLEVPLLLELAAIKPALADEADEVWVTIAPESTVVRRQKEKSGMSEEQTRARIRSQLSSAERQKQADVVIETDCSLDELRGKVGELWQKLDI